jgi:hypothetical protein
MSTLSHSERLRQKIEIVLPAFIDVCNELVGHPRFAELYPEMLVSMYWMIRASVPQMQATLDRCRELAATDRVAAAMAPYLEQHIREEMHHDEWMLEDLELLGVPRRDVLQRIPSPNAASLAGTRHYWVMYHHPVAELGGLAVMEGYPASLEAIDLMQELTGFPRQAFRTIEKHAHLDSHHRDELLALIDALPLEEEHHELLGVSAFFTVKTASAVYREIVDRAAYTGELAIA